MKLSIEFVPYILDQRANEIAVFLEKSMGEKIDQKLPLAMLHEVIEVITSYTTPGSEVTRLATMSFRKVKQLLESEDPYDMFKKMDLRVAKEVIKQKAKELDEEEKLERKLEKTLYLSTLANSINTIYSGSSDFFRSHATDLDNAIVRGLKPEEFLQDVKDRKVAYVVNSLAEMVFDAKVMELLLENIGVAELQVYVKTDAYANDATYNDVVNNIELPPQADIIRMETDAAGVDKNLSPKQAIKSLMSSEVIISKGLMNYCGFTNMSPAEPHTAGDKERFSKKVERKTHNGEAIPVYSFMVIRSPPVARRLGVLVNTPIVKKTILLL